MTQRETFWSLGMLGALLLALWIFRRLRRPTRGFAEGQAFKARLPPWVRTLEQSVWVALSLAIGGACLAVFVAVHRSVAPGRPVEGASVVFSAIGILLIALPIAMLGANGVSWLLPPVRAANLRAMEGLKLSFGALNRGLLLFACVSIPLGLLELATAALEPWAR